jgi:ribulose-5-phosphate 4-epimerase/fuculose-1-phosphate aldolase
MPTDLAQLRYEIALANRILSHEGVLDAFGHVSARHPDDPNKYLLSRSRAPELVEPDDIIVFDLESNPAEKTDARFYGERVIHGEIFKARPDVMAVCHHHAASMMPYVISSAPLVPVFHLGATLGQSLPNWDQREEFGVTNLLVLKPEEGASLAKALGPYWTVLMRRHGATVAGTTLRELVFRCIYGCRNAEFLTEAPVKAPAKRVKTLTKAVRGKPAARRGRSSTMSSAKPKAKTAPKRATKGRRTR